MCFTSKTFTPNYTRLIASDASLSATWSELVNTKLAITMEHGLLGWLVTRALLSSLFVGIFSNNGAITSLLRQTPWSFASKDIGQELLEKYARD